MKDAKIFVEQMTQNPSSKIKGNMNMSNIYLYAIVLDVNKFREKYMKYYKQYKELKGSDSKR